MSASIELQPTAPGERLLQLDVLRGLALFGVLLVNIGAFGGSDWALEGKLPYPMGWGGDTLAFLRATLLESKAAALLGMLFGVGLTIQWENAMQKGRAYLPFALRRVGALALIGTAHSFLLWNVDILLDYAVISLLVLPFINVRRSRILWAIPVLLVVSLLIAAPFLSMGNQAAQPGWFYTMGLRYYGSGTWLEALKFRSWEMIHVLGPVRLSNRLPILTPFFILGVYFWKNGLLAAPEKHLRTLRTLFCICFFLGLLANLLPQETVHAWVAGISARPLRILIKATAFFARPGLTVGYAAGILLLLQHPWWRNLLSLFAPLGRMALTQYLLQSVVCTWIFNGYGFGLYGKVPMNLCILGGVAFFAVQVWSSHLWLTHFRVGPAEWLWRRMTYGTSQPFRLQPSFKALTSQERTPDV